MQTLSRPDDRPTDGNGAPTLPPPPAVLFPQRLSGLPRSSWWLGLAPGLWAQQPRSGAGCSPQERFGFGNGANQVSLGLPSF